MSERATILHGDCLAMLKTIPAGTVRTCVTSPPYFGLRDYGTAAWAGGDPGCDHVQRRARQDKDAIRKVDAASGRRLAAESYLTDDRGAIQYPGTCGKCGAIRQDSQIGLEQTPAAYVAALVDVFREVRRVLSDDGTVWLNLGDSYAASSTYQAPRTMHSDNGWKQAGEIKSGGVYAPDIGMKPKNLIGIPWRVAFALQDDGWYLRSDIIWHKPNPMPESVTDRPTKAHEYLFLLAKSAKYFYDADAVREEATYTGKPGRKISDTSVTHGIEKHNTGIDGVMARYHNGDRPTHRNRRTVWTVATTPYAGAHFATFPPKLIEPCILAGTSEKGKCSACGAAWARVVERTKNPDRDMEAQREYYAKKTGRGDGHISGPGGMVDQTKTIGWQPSCNCDAPTVPDLVLDPFTGSGTTAEVALKHGRHFIGCELNADYIALARKRIAPLLMQERLF